MSTYRTLGALTTCDRCGHTVDPTWRAKVTHSATCDEQFQTRAARRRALIRAREERALDSGVSPRNCLRNPLQIGRIGHDEAAPDLTPRPPLNAPFRLSERSA